MSHYWRTIETLAAGADAVRAAGERFLPKFPDEQHYAYEYRRRTAKYTNIISDILTSLAAKPFRKEVTVKVGSSEAVMDFAEDVDGQGNSLHVFAADVFLNGLQNALDWILVDAPTANPAIKTLADQRRLRWRPYWVRISADQMLDVRPLRSRATSRSSTPVGGKLSSSATASRRRPSSGFACSSDRRRKMAGTDPRIGSSTSAKAIGARPHGSSSTAA